MGLVSEWGDVRQTRDWEVPYVWGGGGGRMLHKHPPKQNNEQNPNPGMMFPLSIPTKNGLPWLLSWCRISSIHSIEMVCMAEARA